MKLPWSLTAMKKHKQTHTFVKMKTVFCATVFYSLVICPGLALDQSWVDSVTGDNCTLYIDRQRKSGEDGLNRSEGDFGSSSPLQCPPWQLPAQNHSCKRGASYDEVLLFQKGTGQTLLLPFYCMTTSENLTERRDVIGGCLFTNVLGQTTLFFPLPCNVSELNRFMCADLNREGQLCGRCRHGYAPPVYSYALHCVNCTGHSYHNWLKYTAIAFGPLTVFCAIIIVFHISATSPFLHGYIFFCQILSLPTVLRLLILNHGYQHHKNIRLYTNIYSGLIGIWNLDFFRLMYEPFCLHPRMTVMQSLFLDYFVALYPLLLVAITYSLVSLYYRNCRVVVLLWKPLRKFLRPLFRDLDIRATLIESFSTLYLLSVVKIQSVSLDLLLPTPLYYADGTKSPHSYLYLAADEIYFSDNHLPYALVAMALFTALVLMPILLLFLYPCQCFQRLLNTTNCNSQVLRTYMDVFQGHYKDGTENSRDFRYFSGVFLVVRMVAVVQVPLMNSSLALLTLGLCVTVLTFAVTILHPQKSHTHYMLDSVFLSHLSIILFAPIGEAHNVFPTKFLRTFSIIFPMLPIIYFTFLTFYWIFRSKRIPQRALAAIWRRVMGCLKTDRQYPELLNSLS